MVCDERRARGFVDLELFEEAIVMTDGTGGRKPGTGRVQFLLIAAVFFGPLLFATWLYYGGDILQPKARTNHDCKPA